MTLLSRAALLEQAVVLDTETTDSKERDGIRPEVIELAFIAKNGATFERRYMPTNPSRWGAIAVHNIMPEELLGCPPATEALLDAPTRSKYWIGHNIDFDWKMLGSPPVKRICTLALARAMWPEVDSHTLTAMTYFTKGANATTRERLRSAHSALADIEHCLDLLEVVIAIAKIQTIEELYELSEDARIPKKMTFGKFAGQPISAVDRGYAAWYRKQPDTDPYLLEAFKRAKLL